MAEAEALWCRDSWRLAPSYCGTVLLATSIHRLYDLTGQQTDRQTDWRYIAAISTSLTQVSITDVMSMLVKLH